MSLDRRFIPYVIVFFTIIIALIWRPYLIGFYGDDYSLAIANSWEDALFYGRRERFFYFFPIAIPRYYFGYDQVGWGWYAITITGMVAMSLYSFFKSVLSRLTESQESATKAAIASAILYIFMPWSITPVLWNTGLSQLVMVGLMAIAGTVLFSRLSTFWKSVLFVSLFTISSLIYETIWGAWIPLILIKFILDTLPERRQTFIIAGWSMLTQIGLAINYLPSFGVTGRVMAGGEFKLLNKLVLLVENIFVRFPFEVLSSMGVFGLAAVPFVIFILYWIFKRKSELTKQQFWLVMLACIAGILGSITVVTLGNYRITATTDDARFLSAVSMWISLMIGMVISLTISNGTKNLRTAGCVVYVLIVIAFFVRSNDWVQGYLFQRYVIDIVPVEEITKLLDEPIIVKTAESVSTVYPALIVEFDTPLHLFHGWGNTRGITFISRKIKNETGKEVEGIPAEGRIWKTIMDGSRTYQLRCANLKEVEGEFIAVASAVYWRIKTGEVRKISPPFTTGCTRTINRFEFLGELLYPFMGNPRRQ